jgi:hypothetical protein
MNDFTKFEQLCICGLCVSLGLLIAGALLTLFFPLDWMIGVPGFILVIFATLLTFSFVWEREFKNNHE